jgi:exonuclease III
LERQGLKDKNKRLTVRQTILMEKSDIIGFQKTKLDSIDDRILTQICGRRLSNFKVLNSDGTRGVLIAWSENKIKYISHSIKRFSVCVTFQIVNGDQNLIFTGVYGPSTTILKDDFFGELLDIKPVQNIPWVLCGDFNVTLAPDERNTTSQNWRGMFNFADLINNLDLIDLPLNGRRFTWSNERDDPTMAKLDRFLISTYWNSIMPNLTQRALPNTSSDHCPILFTAETKFQKTSLSL